MEKMDFFEDITWEQVSFVLFNISNSKKVPLSIEKVCTASKHGPLVCPIQSIQNKDGDTLGRGPIH